MDFKSLASTGLQLYFTSKHKNMIQMTTKTLKY